MTELLYPIMRDYGKNHDIKLPWKLIASHERQALINHDQTLTRLAERGGLSPCEALAILEDRQWFKIENAEQALKEFIAHQYSQARAECGQEN